MIKRNVSCIHCKKEFSFKGIHTHFLATHSTKEDKDRVVGSKNSRNHSSGQHQIDQANKKRSIYNSNPVLCCQCNTSIPYGKRSNRFCSSSCAAIYTNAKKDWTKIKTGPTKGSPTNKPPANKRGLFTPIFMCKICSTWNVGSHVRVVCDNKDCRHKNLIGRTGGYRPNSTRVHRSEYKGYWMESGAELYFAQQLDAHNIHWHKNSTLFFPFIKSSGESGKYYPDFYLKDYDCWVEIKGKRYMRPDDPARRAAVGKPVHLIISNNFKTELPIFFKMMAGMTSIELA